MKKKLTELVFILDKSGSMAGLENDTIGGYNSMLEKQQALPGKAYITTVLFDHSYTLLHDRIDIRAVKPITGNEYQAGGNTALIDAIGKTIHKIVNAQKNTTKDYRADNVLFVIITDGHENASREYASAKVKKMVEQQKSQYGWEFIFLGANIDAVETAAHFGIAPDRAQNYHNDGLGAGKNYEALNHVAHCMRVSSKIPSNWNEEIAADFMQRGSDKK